jgi:hypothetical protein
MGQVPPVFAPEDKASLEAPSAIDRFFWSKGSKIYGYAGHTWQLAGIILSVAHSIAALLFIILYVSAKGFPVVFPLIFGIAAVISLVGLSWTYVRNKNTQSENRISSSGRKLLYKIGQHIGWNDQYAPHNNRGNPLISLWQQLTGVRTARNVLSPNGTEFLEAGCSQYNRISGLLNLAKDTTAGRSSNLMPQIQAASDEAIANLINQVALLEDNPETQNAVASQCQIQVSKLTELANRFEEALKNPLTLTERLSSASVMDDVLDRLSLEAQAYEELRTIDRIDQQS